jgi:peptidoglycan-associated lipoprotein
MNKLISLAAACSLLAACSSTPQKTEPAPAPAPAPVAAPAPAAPAPVAPAAESEAAKLARMSQDLMKQSVYFDFDKYDVKPEFRSVVESEASFMKQASAYSMVLQGNCDERGSREYNIALGNKRAEAVRKQLSLLGIDAGRMETVSFGKEKPRATCHDESCWKENRRVDFVFKAK